MAEEPATWTLSKSALLGLYLATRAEPREPSRAFRNRERVIEAIARGEITYGETIRIGKQVVTVGRYLVAECLPPTFRSGVFERPSTAHSLARLLPRVVRQAHVEIAGRAAEALEILGRTIADRSGVSPAAMDFAPPATKPAILARTLRQLDAIGRDFADGLTTDGERYCKVLDTWSSAHDWTRADAHKEGAHVRRARADGAPGAGADALDPLAALAAADREAPRPESVRAIVGPAIKRSSGELFEAGIAHSIGEGLTAHEFMMAAMAARGRTLTRIERDGEAAELLRDLDAALGEATIVLRDCETQRGVLLSATEAHGETVTPLRERVEGKIAARDVVAPDGAILARAGQLLTPALARRIEDAAIHAVLVRDVLTCDADAIRDGGVCAVCFGLDPVDATWLCPGDPIGARAARTIAREARSFGERSFHIC